MEALDYFGLLAYTLMTSTFGYIAGGITERKKRNRIVQIVNYLKMARSLDDDMTVIQLLRKEIGDFGPGTKKQFNGD